MSALGALFDLLSNQNVYVCLPDLSVALLRLRLKIGNHHKKTFIWVLSFGELSSSSKWIIQKCL